MYNRIILFSAAIGLLITPQSHSFKAPSQSQLHPQAPRSPPLAAPVWNIAQHNLINSRSHHNKKTYHSMTPYISTVCAIGQTPSFTISTYIFLTNMIYLLRRSHLRDLTKRQLLRIRLTREEGVSLPLHITNIIVWQLFVTSIFPVLEPIMRLFGYVSFYYFYPNASGVGIIFEPLSAQQFSMSKKAKTQIRCDWHRFSVNIGAVGRDGYRHPPRVERNWPHLDIPKKGWKHWPWRRKFNVERGE